MKLRGVAAENLSAAILGRLKALPQDLSLKETMVLGTAGFTAAQCVQSIVLNGVKPEDGALVLELMHFADELADTSKLHIPKKVEVGKREMNMATALVDSMSAKWKPEKYHDDYREALMEVIEEKVESGGKEIEEKPKKAPKPTKVIDLVKVLQQSLEQTGKAKTKSSKRAGKHPQRHQKAA